MVSVGTLAAGVAHEINNPLAYVISNLDFVNGALPAQIGARADLSRDQVEALKEAREGAERVRLIVRDLKTFSRADDVDRGPVDVHEVLSASANMAWNEIRHRARLVKHEARGLKACGNEARLGQVFLNLLVNAAQSIPEGDAEHNEIRIATRAQDESVIVEVSDTGRGISPEDRPRLFDPFFTTKPVGVGTGLGLYVCQNIVASLGGSITVESEIGRGSTFRVTLPAATSLVAERRPAATARSHRRGRILVVDDEPQICSALRRSLPEHDVETAATAAQALSSLRAGSRFDVIFCDLMMPQQTGADFYAALVRETPDQASRIVFLTGGAFSPSSRAFLDSVENPNIEKPFDLVSLRALIGERLRHQGAGGL